MKIKHYLYNAFTIEEGITKIAIDPGQNLWMFKLTSLIPKEEWPNITHVLVTHGDPDHYWNADRVALSAGAPLIMHKSMCQQDGGSNYILAPRKEGLVFHPFSGQVILLETDEVCEYGKVKIRAIKSTHGKIAFNFLGKKMVKTPGPEERAGFGAIGFKIELEGKTILNLGDSVLLEEWKDLSPDILMLPIGGMGNSTWTMDVTEALEAVKLIKPKMVIPCHYNCAFFWNKNINPADDQYFKQQVGKMGITCQIMKRGEERMFKFRA